MNAPLTTLTNVRRLHPGISLIEITEEQQRGLAALNDGYEEFHVTLVARLKDLADTLFGNMPLNPEHEAALRSLVIDSANTVRTEFAENLKISENDLVEVSFGHGNFDPSRQDLNQIAGNTNSHVIALPLERHLGLEASGKASSAISAAVAEFLDQPPEHFLMITRRAAEGITMEDMERLYVEQNNLVTQDQAKQYENAMRGLLNALNQAMAAAMQNPGDAAAGLQGLLRMVGQAAVQMSNAAAVSFLSKDESRDVRQTVSNVMKALDNKTSNDPLLSRALKTSFQQLQKARNTDGGNPLMRITATPRNGIALSTSNYNATAALSSTATSSLSAATAAKGATTTTANTGTTATVRTAGPASITSIADRTRTTTAVPAAPRTEGARVISFAQAQNIAVKPSIPSATPITGTEVRTSGPAAAAPIANTIKNGNTPSPASSGVTATTTTPVATATILGASAATIAVVAPAAANQTSGQTLQTTAPANPQATQPQNQQPQAQQQNQQQGPQAQTPQNSSNDNVVTQPPQFVDRTNNMHTTPASRSEASSSVATVVKALNLGTDANETYMFSQGSAGIPIANIKVTAASTDAVTFTAYTDHSVKMPVEAKGPAGDPQTPIKIGVPEVKKEEVAKADETKRAKYSGGNGNNTDDETLLNKIKAEFKTACDMCKTKKCDTCGVIPFDPNSATERAFAAEQRAKYPRNQFG